MLLLLTPFLFDINNAWHNERIFLFFLVDVLKQIVIPSVFVSEQTATTLKDDYMYDKGWVWNKRFIQTEPISFSAHLSLFSELFSFY